MNSTYECDVSLVCMRLILVSGVRDSGVERTHECGKVGERYLLAWAYIASARCSWLSGCRHDTRYE